MKISKLFHWLYFFVMALPIVVAPIFALYTTNKNGVFNNTIQVEEDKLVNFNQLFHNDLDYSFTRVDGSFTILDDSLIDFYVPSQEGMLNFDLFGSNDYYTHFLVGHKYYIRANLVSGSFSQNLFMYPGYYNFNEVFLNDTDRYSSLHYYIDNQVTNYEVEFYFNVFDLTIMFGSGNEPTKAQFDIWYPNENYVFNSGETQLLHTGIYDTLSDTDIGSQFFYSMYNCVDKYFNYDRVFNFGDLYTWLNTTFFGAQAPLGFFIFWHLLIYWLLTSLLWLVFDVLMYVPQLVHRWLDKASIS